MLLRPESSLQISFQFLCSWVDLVLTLPGHTSNYYATKMQPIKKHTPATLCMLVMKMRRLRCTFPFGRFVSCCTTSSCDPPNRLTSISSPLSPHHINFKKERTTRASWLSPIPLRPDSTRSTLSSLEGSIPSFVIGVILTFLGGTAGCVVAGRLAAADPTLSILVVEGGNNSLDDPTIRNPGVALHHLRPDSKTAIFYQAEEAEQLAGRAPMVPSGGVLGGGSAINFMM